MLFPVAIVFRIMALTIIIGIMYKYYIFKKKMFYSARIQMHL